MFLHVFFCSWYGQGKFTKNGFRILPFSIKKTRASAISNVYKRIVGEGLQKQIQMFASVAHLQLRTHPKKKHFTHPMETSLFPLLESRTRQVILRNALQQVFWDDDSKGFPRSFVRFLRIFLDKIASSLKGSALKAFCFMPCWSTPATRKSGE